MSLLVALSIVCSVWHLPRTYGDDEMTVSPVLENAVTPLQLIQSNLHLEASAEVAGVLGHITTRIVRPVQGGHPEFGVDWRREPVTLWGDGPCRADLGFQCLLEERARNLGRTVRVDREGVRFCDLELPADYSGVCAEMLTWVAEHPLGVIRYNSHIGLSNLLRELIRTFQPQASIAVLFGSRKHRQRTTAELSPNWIGGSLLRSERVYDEPPHVAVGRFCDISRRDVGLENYDLVVIARATDAVGKLAQEVLASRTLRCRVIGLLPADVGQSPIERGRMMATFGPSQFFVPDLGRVERVVHYARLQAPNRRVRNHHDDVRFLRDAVWCNNSLNNFLAQSASTLANGSVAGVPILPGTAEQLPNLGPDTNVILACDNVEHAAELARQLPDWSVQLGADCHMDGLPRAALQALRRNQSTGSMMGSRKQIMTVDAVRVHDITNTGILIWCGTSGGLPPISRNSLLADSRSRSAARSLLLIDLVDRSHIELHHRSRERECLCLHRGWVPPNTTPEIVRSIAFDDEVSGNAEHLSVSQRARRRHFVGETLPRLVNCARWYPQSATAQPGSPTDVPILPPLAQVIHNENLLATYRRMRGVKGQGAGVDGLSYRDFSSLEITSLLRWASRAIRERRYRPHPTKLVLIRKTSGGWRELRLMTILDRVVATALKDALEPVLDCRFLDSSYGFRPGKSREQMVAQMMHDMVVQSRYVIGLEDVRDAFPSVRLDPLLGQLRDVLSAIEVAQRQPGLVEDWLWMLEVMVRGAYPDNRDCGLDQGSPLSPLLLNQHLQVVLDQPLRAADLGGAPQYRYADNTGTLCRDFDECHQVLALTRTLLGRHGLDLKGWQPVNVARQGTQVDILGFSLRLTDGVPQLQLKDSAFADLSDDLAECYEADDPEGVAIQVAAGWLAAQGPAFEFCEEEGVLQRLYRASARAGFRELGPVKNLRDIIQKGRTTWLDSRSQIAQSDRHSSLG